MNTYICKCGKEIRTNSTAAVTGNRLENYAEGHECYGCPYIVEVQKWTKYPEFKIIHECETSKRVFHRTVADGFDDSTRSCSVQSLDFDFLRKVADYCVADENLTINREENGNIFGYKTSYQANGLYRLPIYPTSNKAGIAAKKTVFECFFNEDGTREDTGGADETEIVLAQIARGKEQAKWEITEVTTASETKASAEPSTSEKLKESKMPNTEQPKQKTNVHDINVASMPEEIIKNDLVEKIGIDFIVETMGYKGDNEKFVREFLPKAESGQKALDALCDGFDECDNCPCYESCTHETEKDVIFLHIVEQWNDFSVNGQKYTPNVAEPVEQPVAELEEQTEQLTEQLTEQPEPTEKTVATDTNVEDKPEQPEPDNRSTLVASPLDFAGAALAPAFDYSSVDDKIASVLHSAENRIANAKRHYVVECAFAVAMAHDALCSTVVQQLENGKFAKKEETFLAWCESVGLKKSTAYNFLQVYALFNAADEDEQAILEAAPATLLYAAAKPSAPTELVEAVKQGDITSNAQYQKLLKANQELKKEVAQFESDWSCLEEDLSAANARAEEAEEKRKRFQASSNEANQLAYEKISELNKLKKEMESRPVDVAVQQPSEADIARYRAEGAKAATAEWQERYEDIEAQNHAYKDMMREKDAQIAELVAYEPDQDLLGDTAATMQEFGKHTAQIMETALRLFFDAAADKPDFIYNPAAQYLYDIHAKFSQALNFGKWPEDEGSEQDGT